MASGFSDTRRQSALKDAVEQAQSWFDKDLSDSGKLKASKEVNFLMEEGLTYDEAITQVHREFHRLIPGGSTVVPAEKNSLRGTSLSLDPQGYNAKQDSVEADSARSRKPRKQARNVYVDTENTDTRPSFLNPGIKKTRNMW